MISATKVQAPKQDHHDLRRSKNMLTSNCIALYQITECSVVMPSDVLHQFLQEYIYSAIGRDMPDIFSKQASRQFDSCMQK